MSVQGEDQFLEVVVEPRFSRGQAERNSQSSRWSVEYARSTWSERDMEAVVRFRRDECRVATSVVPVMTGVTAAIVSDAAITPRVPGGVLMMHSDSKFGENIGTYISIFGGQVISIVLMIVLIVHGYLNGDISSLVVAVVLCAFTLMWFMTYLRNRRSKWSGLVDMINGEYKLSPVNRLASYPSFISFFVVVVFVGWKMLGAADGAMSWRRKATTVLVVGCIGIVVYIAEALRPWKIGSSG